MNSKISELDLVSIVDQNDVLPIVNDGITKKVKVSQLEQDFQSVTDKGASTTNSITVETIDSTALSVSSINGGGIYGESFDSIGLEGYSVSGTGVQSYSQVGIPIQTYGAGNNTPSVEVNLANTNKGVVIESGTSSTGNPIEVKKNGVTKFRVAQNGDVTTDVISANGDILTLEAGATKIQINDLSGDITVEAGSFNLNCPILADNIQAGQYRIPALNTAPATATSTGILGEIRYTSDFIYVCIATNTWRRTALTSW